MKYKIIATILFGTFFVSIAFAQLHVYPEAGQSFLPHNDDYTVKVREKGGEWKDLFEYCVHVDMDSIRAATMVQFDMSGEVEVMVKKNNGFIQKVDIRPYHKQINHTIVDNVVMFTLNEPCYLSVEFNGDRLRNLHLFANPPETETYSAAKEGVMYFGPGVHRPGDLPNNQIRVPDNTTVYLAPGAVVKAKLLVDKAENVKIIGRGIIDHAIRGIEVTDSKNVTIDGITVVNPNHYSIFGGGAQELTIRNFKSFSCQGWSDGIDLMCCRNVNINNIFMRNSDDCIALYNHRWNWKGGSSDITVEKAVLWADIAHPVNMGGHGDSKAPIGEVLENVVMRDIDILEHDEDDRNYQGCLSIDCGDQNIVRNILFEDIRIDNFQEGRLFNIRVVYNKKYNLKPGGKVEKVMFRNITYNGVGANRSIIMGYDQTHPVCNVKFENVTLNGKRMKNTDDFILNEYVTDIEVK